MLFGITLLIAVIAFLTLMVTIFIPALSLFEAFIVALATTAVIMFFARTS